MHDKMILVHQQWLEFQESKVMHSSNRKISRFTKMRLVASQNALSNKVSGLKACSFELISYLLQFFKLIAFIPYVCLFLRIELLDHKTDEMLSRFFN